MLYNSIRTKLQWKKRTNYLNTPLHRGLHQWCGTWKSAHINSHQEKSIKPKVSYHSLPPERLTVKRLITPKAGEDVEQPDSRVYSVDAPNSATSFGKVLAAYFNLIIVYLPPDPIPHFHVYSTEIDMFTRKCLQHLCYSHKLKTTQMSNSRWTQRQIVVYLYNGITLPIKRNELPIQTTIQKNIKTIVLIKTKLDIRELYDFTYLKFSN